MILKGGLDVVFKKKVKEVASNQFFLIKDGSRLYVGFEKGEFTSGLSLALCAAVWNKQCCSSDSLRDLSGSILMINFLTNLITLLWSPYSKVWLIWQ